MTRPETCKFYKKMRKKGYNRCLRDNSIRNGSCPCPYYKWRLIHKLKEKIEDWLWGVIYGRR